MALKSVVRIFFLCLFILGVAWGELDGIGVCGAMTLESEN